MRLRTGFGGLRSRGAPLASSSHRARFPPQLRGGECRERGGSTAADREPRAGWRLPGVGGSKRRGDLHFFTRSCGDAGIIA